ncbi:MAG: hypothetical protein JJ895_04570 [Balneolaceae bacterium]|nr:hypothetical protein [Balneolaceae bacterium]
MKKEEIDALIEESLSQDEAKFYHELEEPGLFTQWMNLYRTKFAGWMIVATIAQLIFTALAVWTGYRFFTAIEANETSFWGMCFILSVLGNAMLKLWHWMQMDKYAVMQEMKRIEFQIAVLTDKLTSQK